MAMRDTETWKKWLDGNPLVVEWMGVASFILTESGMQPLVLARVIRQAFCEGFDAGRGDGVHSWDKGTGN